MNKSLELLKVEYILLLNENFFYILYYWNYLFVHKITFYLNMIHSIKINFFLFFYILLKLINLIFGFYYIFHYIYCLLMNDLLYKLYFFCLLMLFLSFLLQNVLTNLQNLVEDLFLECQTINYCFFYYIFSQISFL